MTGKRSEIFSPIEREGLKKNSSVGIFLFVGRYRQTKSLLTLKEGKNSVYSVSQW